MSKELELITQAINSLSDLSKGIQNLINQIAVISNGLTALLMLYAGNGKDA